jgi:hypothetical protein
MKISKETKVDKEQKETVEQESSKDDIHMSIGNKRVVCGSETHE